MKERPTARVVLINSENKILLIKVNSAHEGICWITPGGGIEHNETPLEAAKRELFEESGITKVEFVTPHSWYWEVIRIFYGVSTLFKEHIFLAYTKESVVTLDNLEEDERDYTLCLQWWDVNALKENGEALYPRSLIEIFDSVLSQNNTVSRVQETNQKEIKT
jgi:ADP-ribose pyrophosphatase YjhB (NUDIX family)